jgi:hypothetical protein
MSSTHSTIVSDPYCCDAGRTRVGQFAHRTPSGVQDSCMFMYFKNFEVIKPFEDLNPSGVELV